VRLVKNLYSFWVSIRKNQVKNTDQLQLVLLSRKTTPYSFGSYVFVNQGEYENGKIEPEILVHEQAHIQQRHSLDIVFVELLLVFAWWNPALWLYRRAIMLNHEFLADDWVIKTSKNVEVYQHLLLQRITHNKNLMLASPFNYLITKKRFKMMSRMTSLSRAYALQAGTAVLFAVLVPTFGNISFAQTSPPAVVSPASSEAVPFTQEGASREQVEEYNQIIDKYLKKGVENGKEWRVLHMPNEIDRARLEVIFKTMSEEQQSAQQFAMNPPLPPLFRATPTEKEFEAYKNPKVYGVWINEKKVPNTELNKYKASDFSQVFVSRLSGGALKTIGYKYKYQLDLMTNEHYEKYRAEKLADKRYWLGYNRAKMKKEMK
jgi:translation elongation factor P/translation initiation factor 5A